VAVVWLDEVIFWELNVNFEVFLGSDGPHAIDGGVVGPAVLQPVGTDVGSADEVLGQMLQNFNLL
jgi:hypothetical protein